MGRRREQNRQWPIARVVRGGRWWGVCERRFGGCESQLSASGDEGVEDEPCRQQGADEDDERDPAE